MKRKTFFVAQVILLWLLFFPEALKTMSPVVFGGLIPGALIAATCETLGATVPLVGHLQRGGSPGCGWENALPEVVVGFRAKAYIHLGSNHLRMVMEPKYFAFRRWLDTPSSCSDVWWARIFRDIDLCFCIHLDLPSFFIPFVLVKSLFCWIPGQLGFWLLLSKHIWNLMLNILLYVVFKLHPGNPKKHTHTHTLGANRWCWVFSHVLFRVHPAQLGFQCSRVDKHHLHEAFRSRWQLQNFKPDEQWKTLVV